MGQGPGAGGVAMCSSRGALLGWDTHAGRRLRERCIALQQSINAWRAPLTRGRACAASAAAHDFAQDSKGVALQTDPN